MATVFAWTRMLFSLKVKLQNLKFTTSWNPSGSPTALERSIHWVRSPARQTHSQSRHFSRQKSQWDWKSWKDSNPDRVESDVLIIEQRRVTLEVTLGVISSWFAITICDPFKESKNETSNFENFFYLKANMFTCISIFESGLVWWSLVTKVCLLENGKLSLWIS